MKLALVALLPLTMACAAVPAEPGTGSGSRCNAASLGNLVGQAATQQLGAEALRRSGARTLRWMRPGDIVTMEYREDRLNIRLDGRNNVAGFTCG